jgi:Ca2+-binding RTX toxin-like protein
MTLHGVYGGTSTGGVLAYENWLGAESGMILTHLDMRDWDKFEGSAAGYARDVWSQIDRPVLWSIPLVVQGASLELGATGAYNAHFLKVAQWINSYSTGDEIHIRPGWEFNGYWMPWSAKGHEQAYIDTFRQLVDTFRSVSDRFVFEWNVNSGDYGMDPATCYPGDAYVDFIGMDFYQDPAWATTPQSAWNNMVNRPYSLQWLEDFADAHGKPTAYSEWGVGANNMGPYVELAKAWFDSHDVAYQTYWNSNAGGYIGKLSDGAFPDLGDSFREVFVVTPQSMVAQASQASTSVFTGRSVLDFWIGTDGHDQYTSNGGGDFMMGGHGDDIYVVSSGADRVIEWSSRGVDTIITGLGAYTLPQYVENLTLTGTLASRGAGNDLANIITGNDGANALIGGAGDDKLIANGGDDVLRGGVGNDQLNAGEGNDRIFGDDGSDSTSGGNGNDYIEGGLGNDQVIGDGGNDTLYGGDARDFVNGGNGNDLMDGGNGNDEMWGFAGDDVIHGGNDLDRLFGNDGNDSLLGGAGNDLLTGASGNDRLDGGAGIDTAAFSGNAAAFRVDAAAVAGQWIVTELAMGWADTVLNVEYLQFNDVKMQIASGM